MGMMWVIKLRRESTVVNDCLLPEMDRSNRMNSFLIEETENPRLTTCRSLSLPPTLIPTSDLHDNGYGTYLDMTGARPSELKPHERLLKNFRNSAIEEGGDYYKELLNSLSSDRYVSLLTTGREEEDVQTLLKKGLSRSQQELLDLMQHFKQGESTISNVEAEFQQWRRKHCTSREEQMKRTRKTSAFAFMWKKPKKKDSKNGNGCKQISDAKQEEKVSTRKISNTSASSASSKTSTSTFSSREDTTSSEQKLDEFCTAPTKWVSSYSPSTRRLFQPHYPDLPPPLPSRPPPTPRPLTKPVPLPRKKLPPGVRAESSRIIEEEKSIDIKQDALKPADDEEKNVSIVELCEKYGLQTLGECFISGTCLSREQLNELGKEEPEPVRARDSDGYEIPIRLRFRIQEDLLSIGGIRRSFSWPSNLHKSFEHPEDPPMIPSCKSVDVMNENGDSSRMSCNCDCCYSIHESFSSNIYMSLLDYRRDSLAEGGVSGGLSGSQQELIDLMYAFKRGDQTMSQVEKQFHDWHWRHMKAPPSGDKSKEEKSRKQSSFGLPGLKNLILGKPKKKGTLERKHSEDTETLNRMKKISDASSTSQKRMSYISTSSANSESNEVFRLAKENGRRPEVSADSTPPPYPKRPPPMPPNKPPSGHDLHRTNQHRSPDSSSLRKPIPPPKPKTRLQSMLATLPQSEIPNSNGEPKEDNEDDVRPSSPDYIVPNVHVLPLVARKKFSEARCNRTAEKNVHKFSLQHLAGDSIPRTRFLLDYQPSASRYKELSPPNELALPSQTLELLQKANLLPDAKASMFYIRRSSSYPSLSSLQLKSQPIYLELLNAADETSRSKNLSGNSGSLDAKRNR
ncbi:DBB domain-containing protein [Caerostris darwini]|uniref:DBB domain-containing protein n=1 Tax=Caerostris darwini TaxID=1538125 RepID=A0AAV4U5Q9_9ARAC|nr:DBB domain-containing protein [Caerostris darwini]